MRTTESFRRFMVELLLSIYILNLIVPITYSHASSKTDSIVYPIKKISKLECRFEDFDSLSSSCKKSIPILKTKDYEKYIKENNGYNEYTRIYTELWGASYKYGWDVGYGGHQGVDIASAKGTPVYSIADGIILHSTKNGAWGNLVTIEHTIRGKKVYSNYAHLSKLIAKEGNKIKAGEIIGEIGSTGNSTGNHLHFQIDLDTPFHPYYYDYKACPYSYNDITEKGVCFDELQKNTVDPILFLETKGKILDDIDYKVLKVSRNDFDTKIVDTLSKSKGVTAKPSTTKTHSDLSIFTKTVYDGYYIGDIKEVQQIFKDLGYYKGKIDGNYKNIEDIIIKYQIKKGVIDKKTDYGAGRFGPSTRKTVKKDYDKYLSKNNKKSIEIEGERGPKVKISSNKTSIVSKIKVKKISRKSLMTREEIEAMEIDNFLKYNSIETIIDNVGGNIVKGSSIKLDININQKQKNRTYKGSTPGNITFVSNNKYVKVFPQKVFNFSRGHRDITITGLKEGNTKLKVMLGQKVLKTYTLKVYDKKNIVYPKSSSLYTSNKVVLGEIKKGLAVFKDSKNKKLINLEYGSTYTLNATQDAKVCIKKGSISDIRQIYSKTCKEEDFKDKLTFDYSDTVGGILIFDYKFEGKSGKIEIINNYNKSILVTKRPMVIDPKGLKDYVYKDDVIDLLSNGVNSSIKKGYFMENKQLTEYDAFKWIKSILSKIEKDTQSNSTKIIVKKKLKNLEKENKLKSKTLTRLDFMLMTYKYLNLDNKNTNTNNKYKDLSNNFNSKSTIAFGEGVTWKDDFGKSFFQPKKKITRGEGAYFLNTTINKNNDVMLTFK